METNQCKREVVYFEPKSTLSLYSSYYAEACIEIAVPISAS